MSSEFYKWMCFHLQWVSIAKLLRVSKYLQHITYNVFRYWIFCQSCFGKHSKSSSAKGHVLEVWLHQFLIKIFIFLLGPEELFPEFCKSDMEMQCLHKNERHCIPMASRCDRIKNCLHGEDEDGCGYSTTAVPSSILFLAAPWNQSKITLTK